MLYCTLIVASGDLTHLTSRFLPAFSLRRASRTSVLHCVNKPPWSLSIAVDNGISELRTWIGLRYDSGCADIGTSGTFRARWIDTGACVTETGGWESQTVNSADDCIRVKFYGGSGTYSFSDKHCDSTSNYNDEYVVCQQYNCQGERAWPYSLLSIAFCTA